MRDRPYVCVCVDAQVRWIDFAHTFPSKGAHDTNVLSAVDTLLAMLPELK